jgi:hypothetical protein
MLRRLLLRRILKLLQRSLFPAKGNGDRFYLFYT